MDRRAFRGLITGCRGVPSLILGGAWKTAGTTSEERSRQSPVSPNSSLRSGVKCSTRNRLSLRIYKIVAVLCCVGCGYTAGFKLPEGVDTIHVKVFENKTFYRKLDFDVTQVIKRELLARTDLKVAREKDADVILSGSVDKVEEFVLREDINDVPQEMQIRLTISAVVKDLDGKILFQENKLDRSVSYVIVLGEDERLARSRALQEVAEELVYRLAEKWGWEDKEDEEAKE